jgi:outer membrane protein insertion porin family
LSPQGEKLGGLVLSHRRCQIGWRWLIGWLLPVLMLSVSASLADPPGPPSPAASPSPVQVSPSPSATADTVVSSDLVGRPVEEVRVTGNAQVPSEVILHQVGTHEHDKFDPAQVEQDYQKIYALKRFSNVEARVEPTAKGVIVIFDVTEEKLIKSIRFSGNLSIDTADLLKSVDLRVGDAIDTFRISLAKRTIINQLRGKNHPFAHVYVNMTDLTATGDLVFTVVEGPPVTIRNIQFIGARSFDYPTLNDQIKTTRWWWIFNSGNYDLDEVEQDVAILRHYYQSKGFFDVKVGRKLIFSPDQSEMEVDFLIDEGVRYKVGQVKFTGNKNVTDADLRARIKLTEGQIFDDERLQLDIKQVVAAYSPLGYIYNPLSSDPGYLQIGKPSYPFGILTLVHMERGVVDLVYEISEGKAFRTGRIIVKGNAKTQDKVIERELHVQPGQLYNSYELQEAIDRLRGLPEFSNATITPIGNQPDTRDVLVEVTEKKTADIKFGIAANSNLGLSGNIGITQTNFDATALPTRMDDWFNGRAFTGAGERFSATFQPGIYATNAEVSFTEPYIFDLPYYTSDEAYFNRYIREAWYEQHAGGAISLGKQFNYNLSSAISFGAEDVKIGGIQDYYPTYQRVDILDPYTHLPTIDPLNGEVETQLRSPRAPEILERMGHNTQTDVGLQIRYDATNHGPLVYKGYSASFAYKFYGALGGQYDFSQFTASAAEHSVLFTDLLDRKTVLNLSMDAGYITPDAPFFDRFYGGGRGSIRGFEFRGASPRSGRDGDPVGGDFMLVQSTEVSFPIYGDGLRGVLFNDIGTVESDIRIHTIRDGVGAGVRVVIPFLGPTPLAFDIAFPVVKGPQDTTQLFSFGVDINR